MQEALLREESSQIDIKIGDNKSEVSVPQSVTSGSPFKSPIKRGIQKFGAGVEAIEEIIVESPNKADPVISRLGEKIMESLKPKKKDDGSPKMAILRNSPSDTATIQADTLKKLKD